MLEEIKKRALFGTDTEDGKVDVWLELADYEYLMEQAKRVKELEKENKKLRETLKDILEFSDLETVVEELAKNALEGKYEY